MSLKELQVSLRWYLSFVIVAGGLAVGLLLWEVSQVDLLGPTPAVVWALAAALLVTETAPAKWLRQENLHVTVSWVFSFAILLSGAPTGAGVVAGAVGLLSDVIHRSPAMRALFNSSQVMLSLIGGGLVLSMLGADAGLLAGRTPTVVWLLSAAVAGAVVFTMNAVFVGIAISISSGEPLLETLRSAVKVTMTTDGLMLALAPVFVVVGQRSVLLLPLIGVTVWAVFRTSEVADSRMRDARMDELTGLPNRRHFAERGAELVAAAMGAQRPVCVMLVDLDGFKGVNDTHGHAAGDELLQVIATRLSAAHPDVDTVARLGGDEFAVLTRVGLSAGDAVEVAAQLRETILEPIALAEATVEVGGSFGLADAPLHGEDLHEVLNCADRAMFEAKSTPTGVYVAQVAEVAETRSSSTSSAVAEIEQALADDALVVHFQPRFELTRGTVSGVEALVRWNHSDGSVRYPGSFMAEVERVDLIHEVTRRVLDRALAMAAEWSKIGVRAPVAVNVSPRDLSSGTLLDDVRDALDRHDVAPELLELEMTERALQRGDVAAVRLALRELRGDGVRLVLDDFGTGVSSLTGLSATRLDGIKIDSSFVARICEHTVDRSVVASLIDLGRRLELDVIAEGVETEEICRVLELLGCPHAQGHLLCRPVGPDVILDRLVQSSLVGDSR